MPLIGSAHLARLRDAAGITFTGYEGEQYGVPAAFPAACYERLASTNTGAARAFARDQVTILPPASKDQLLDIDRPADLTSAERILTHD
jgi:CTP:molybdopterin cytidylyltransferase MocA